MNKIVSQGLILAKYVLLLGWSGLAYARHGEGFGAVATHLMAPVSLMSDFIYTACFVIGGSFLFASLIKYIEHRRSPLMVPIGTPIFLLIAGTLLVCLPFLSLLSETAPHYSLFR